MDEDTLGAYTARGVLLLEIDMQLNSRYVPSKLQFSPVVNSSLVKLLVKKVHQHHHVTFCNRQLFCPDNNCTAVLCVLQ